jgi:hypothetical protein
MDNNPVGQISNVEKGLSGINKQLDSSINKLKQLLGLSGSTFSGIKQILGTNMGQGTTMGLGSANAQFSNGVGGTAPGSNLLPWAYSAKGAATIGGAQMGLGVAGAVYAGLPSLNVTVPRASGFYQASTRVLGMNRKQLAAATFSAFKGGISGTNEDMVAMSVLSQGYNIVDPSNLAQTMAEAKGATLGYGIANATAAQGIGSIYSGPSGGRLYQYGISTVDTKTGNLRSISNIAKQLYAKEGNLSSLTKKQFSNQLMAGPLSSDINNLFTDPVANDLIRRQLTDIYMGVNPNLATKTGADNPLTKTLYKQTTAETSLANKTTEASLAGYATAVDAIAAFNKEMEKTPQSIIKFKAALEAASNSSMGQAGSSILTGITSGLTTIALGSGARAVVKKLSAKSATNLLGKAGSQATLKAGGITALESTAATVAGKTALGAAGKVLPVVGGVISGATGQGFFSSVGTAAAVSGGFGLMAGPEAVIPAAIIGGVLDAIGWVGGKAIKTLAGGGSVSAAPGNQDQQKFAASVLQQLGAPVTDNNVSSLTTWMNKEGGWVKNNATYNPLNTTLAMPGSKSINKVGVKAYGSFDQGVQATVSTLTGSNASAMGYTGIVESLRSNAPLSQTMGAASNSGWVSGKLNQDSYHIGVAGTNTGAAGQTVNINLTISNASDAEAVAFAKKVKDILLKDKALSATGSK